MKLILIDFIWRPSTNIREVKIDIWSNNLVKGLTIKFLSENNPINKIKNEKIFKFIKFYGK